MAGCSPIAAARIRSLRASCIASCRKRRSVPRSASGLALTHCVIRSPLTCLSRAHIRVIQILLGHVNINTAGIYTQVSSKTIRAVASPLDQIVAVMEGRGPPG